MLLFLIKKHLNGNATKDALKSKSSKCKNRGEHLFFCGLLDAFMKEEV